MTDPRNEEAPSAPAPAAPKKPEPKPTPSFEELAESKPAATAKPAAAQPHPATPAAPAPPKVAPKSTPAQASTLDPSISIDDDSEPNVVFLIIDAVAAAIAITFTILLVQDALPFLI